MFDTMSLCYIDKKLIDIPLLDKNEIEWLNNYHSVVFEKISSQLNDDEKEWLREKTSPI
jgi:Xaa-Pro aminopeptidase